ncbi:MAG TPA: ABC transporter permease [Bryobacteraceae bacterium]|nr:ABC transporter permease [Bryobacteraceae bacterium]
MLQDLRYSWRELQKRPGIAITAVLSLTLGIGATTAVFSVMYGLLAHPYPYKDADRMIHLTLLPEKGGRWWVGLNGPQIKQIRQLKSLESVAATWGTWNLTTTDEDLPEDVPSVQLTANSGSHFGVPALLGRTFIPSDAPDGQDPQPVVLLSYLFWQRHYNADPNVIGRRLQLVHKNYSIIGVLPSRFTWQDAAVYVPLKLTNDANINYDPLLRLKPGVSFAAADAELQPLMEQFAKETPDHFPKKFRVQVRGLNEQFEEKIGKSLLLLFGAVSLLLFIGCANVSILLLARGTSRQHELAIRSAIGASRWRIQRQLLTEALGISLLGAAGGVALAFGLLPVLVRFLPDFSIPHEAVIRINLPVLGFSVALAVVSGVLSGLAPAFQFSRPQVAQLMTSSSRRVAGGGRGKRTHNLLVASQIALTLLLLTSAAAAVKGFLKVVHANLGYDPHNIMSVGIPVHQNTHTTWENRSNYFEQIMEKVQALPEVVDAGISSNATPPSNGWDQNYEVFGQPSNLQEKARANFVSPEYFSVLHIPLLQGRLFTRTEVVRGARLAVINQTLAKQYWPHGDAVGKQIRFPNMKGDPPFGLAIPASDQWLQIVGVAADARDDGLRKPVKAGVYVPFSYFMGMWTQVLVRTHTSPLRALNSVRAAIKAVDPDQQAAGQTRDLEQWIEREDEYSYGRLVAGLFGAISLVALMLAAIGLFSVVSYGVAQRTNEFGIRMALGASTGQVLQLVMSATAGNVIGGLAAGALLSFAFSRVITNWAEGSTYDPLLVMGVTLLLILTAALASFVPARRASSVEPMIALRYD